MSSTYIECLPFHCQLKPERLMLKTMTGQRCSDGLIKYVLKAKSFRSSRENNKPSYLSHMVLVQGGFLLVIGVEAGVKHT